MLHLLVKITQSYLHHICGSFASASYEGKLDKLYRLSPWLAANHFLAHYVPKSMSLTPLKKLTKLQVRSGSRVVVGP